MTTTININAYAGWPVQVIEVEPGAASFSIVAAGAAQDKCVYQGKRLFVREMPLGNGSPLERQTEGEYKVGISFNPSANGHVEVIKALAAALIDAIMSVPDPDGNPEQLAEVRRLRALGVTHAEDAAMWGVKAATKQPR